MVFSYVLGSVNTFRSSHSGPSNPDYPFRFLLLFRSPHSTLSIPFHSSWFTHSSQPIPVLQSGTQVFVHLFPSIYSDPPIPCIHFGPPTPVFPLRPTSYYGSLIPVFLFRLFNWCSSIQVTPFGPPFPVLQSRSIHSTNLLRSSGSTISVHQL